MWDSFNMGNVCETLSKIERRSFSCSVSIVKVWYQDACTIEHVGEFNISGMLDKGGISIKHDCNQISGICGTNFHFCEISENGDRIMWSNDLFNTKNQVVYGVPDILSLFFVDNVVMRVYIHIHNPGLLIEFTRPEFD